MHFQNPTLILQDSFSLYHAQFQPKIFNNNKSKHESNDAIR